MSLLDLQVCLSICPEVGALDHTVALFLVFKEFPYYFPWNRRLLFSPHPLFSSIQSLSSVQLFVTQLTTAHQASLSFTISQSLLKLMSIESVMPSNHLILHCPLLLLPSIFLSISVFSKWISSSNQVAKVLELQHQSFQWIVTIDFLEDWLVWSPCCPRDSQESSLAPEFKSINSFALSFLCCATLTSIHDY